MSLFFNLKGAVIEKKVMKILFLLPLRAIVGRAITIEREEKRIKEIIPKIKQRRLRAITSQGAIEKSSILLSQYCENLKLDNTIIISYFWKTNPIFGNCTKVIVNYKYKSTKSKFNLI